MKLVAELCPLGGSYEAEKKKKDSLGPGLHDYFGTWSSEEDGTIKFNRPTPPLGNKRLGEETRRRGHSKLVLVAPLVEGP